SSSIASPHEDVHDHSQEDVHAHINSRQQFRASYTHEHPEHDEVLNDYNKRLEEIEHDEIAFRSKQSQHIHPSHISDTITNDNQQQLHTPTPAPSSRQHQEEQQDSAIINNTSNVQPEQPAISRENEQTHRHAHVHPRHQHYQPQQRQIPTPTVHQTAAQHPRQILPSIHPNSKEQTQQASSVSLQAQEQKQQAPSVSLHEQEQKQQASSVSLQEQEQKQQVPSVSLHEQEQKQQASSVSLQEQEQKQQVPSVSLHEQEQKQQASSVSLQEQEQKQQLPSVSLHEQEQKQQASSVSLQEQEQKQQVPSVSLHEQEQKQQASSVSLQEQEQKQQLPSVSLHEQEQKQQQLLTPNQEHSQETIREQLKSVVQDTSTTTHAVETRKTETFENISVSHIPSSQMPPIVEQERKEPTIVESTTAATPVITDALENVLTSHNKAETIVQLITTPPISTTHSNLDLHADEDSPPTIAIRNQTSEEKGEKVSGIDQIIDVEHPRNVHVHDHHILVETLSKEEVQKDDQYDRHFDEKLGHNISLDILSEGKNDSLVNETVFQEQDIAKLVDTNISNNTEHMTSPKVQVKTEESIAEKSIVNHDPLVNSTVVSSLTSPHLPRVHEEIVVENDTLVATIQTLLAENEQNINSNANDTVHDDHHLINSTESTNDSLTENMTHPVKMDDAINSTVLPFISTSIQSSIEVPLDHDINRVFNRQICWQVPKMFEPSIQLVENEILKGISMLPEFIQAL
ncbi:unnamed protein product, partial [Didymodactylos carnosus]